MGKRPFTRVGKRSFTRVGKRSFNGVVKRSFNGVVQLRGIHQFPLSLSKQLFAQRRQVVAGDDYAFQVLASHERAKLDGRYRRRKHQVVAHPGASAESPLADALQVLGQDDPQQVLLLGESIFRDGRCVGPPHVDGHQVGHIVADEGEICFVQLAFYHQEMDFLGLFAFLQQFIAQVPQARNLHESRRRLALGNGEPLPFLVAAVADPAAFGHEDGRQAVCQCLGLQAWRFVPSYLADVQVRATLEGSPVYHLQVLGQDDVVQAFFPLECAVGLLRAESVGRQHVGRINVETVPGAVLPRVQSDAGLREVNQAQPGKPVAHVAEVDGVQLALQVQVGDGVGLCGRNHVRQGSRPGQIDVFDVLRLKGCYRKKGHHP